MDIGRLVIGLALVFLGLTMISISAVSSFSYGALVMIGPVPIVVSSDAGMAVFLMLLAAIMLLMLYLLRWLR